MARRRQITIHFPAGFRVLKALVAVALLFPAGCAGLSGGGDGAAVPRPRILRPAARTTREFISITGYGRPGDMVRLYVNGSETQTRPVDRDGTFRFDDVGLRPGRNVIAALAEDRAGRRSSGAVSGAGGVSSATGKTSWKVFVTRE